MLGLHEVVAALLAALENVDERGGDAIAGVDGAECAQRHAAIVERRKDGIGKAAVRQDAENGEKADAKVAAGRVLVGEPKRCQVDADRRLDEQRHIVAGKRALGVVGLDEVGKLLAGELDERRAREVHAAVPGRRVRIGIRLEALERLEGQRAAGEAGSCIGIGGLGGRAAHFGRGEHDVQKEAQEVGVGAALFRERGEVSVDAAVGLVIAERGAGASGARRPHLAALAVDHLGVGHEAHMAVAIGRVGARQHDRDALVLHNQVTNAKDVGGAQRVALFLLIHHLKRGGVSDSRAG